MDSQYPMPMPLKTPNPSSKGQDKVATPPTDNPDLPSYQCQSYRNQVFHWEFLEDVYEGRGNWYHPAIGILNPIKCHRYLPKEEREPKTAYENRVKRSPFIRRLASTINGYSDLLSHFTLATDSHESILKKIENIDNQGNSLQMFLKRCDATALLKTHGFLLVEFPKLEKAPESYLDWKNDTRTPYFVWIEPEDVPNWDFVWENGIFKLTQATIKRKVWVKNKTYGSELKTYYRVLIPGAWIEYEMVKDKSGDWIAKEIDGGLTSLQEIPLVVYNLMPTDPFCSESIFSALAELNLQHYQVLSDYFNVMHMMNLPTPVRTGVYQGLPDEASQPVVLGANTVMDLPTGATFQFVEPSGSALSTTRQAIKDIEEEMARFSLEFLSSNSASKTATEVEIRSMQTKATLQGLAAQKESLIQEAFRLWTAYLGAEVGNSGIDIEDDLISTQIGANEMVQLFNNGLLSQKSVLNRLKELTLIDDVEKEIKQIEGEQAIAQEKGMEQMQQQLEMQMAGQQNAINS